MKIGLIGINTLNQEEHFKLIHQALQKNLFGIFSPSEEILPISTNYNVQLFQSTNELFKIANAVYFADSIKPNFDFAINALKKSCHLFIEDLSSLSINEVKQLYKVAFEARVKIQLKRTKSFTPEYLEIKDYLYEPKLIEIKNDYSKFLRHDDYFSEIYNNLLFANQNIHSCVKKTSSFVLPIDNNRFSVVHIRLDYDNGAIVNMKFNNIALENESLVCFHEIDRVVQIDFKKHFTSKYKISEGQIIRKEFNTSNETAINTEISNFINSCKTIDIQNISETPPELKIIQMTHEIKERLIQSTHPV